MKTLLTLATLTSALVVSACAKGSPSEEPTTHKDTAKETPATDAKPDAKPDANADEPPPPAVKKEAKCANAGDCYEALGDPPMDASWDCQKGECMARGAGPSKAFPSN